MNNNNIKDKQCSKPNPQGGLLKGISRLNPRGEPRTSIKKPNPQGGLLKVRPPLVAQPTLSSRTSTATEQCRGGPSASTLRSSEIAKVNPGKEATAAKAPPSSAKSEKTRQYRNRRAAFRILSRLEPIPPGQLSTVDKEKLEWARKIVPPARCAKAQGNGEDKSVGACKKAPKRQRSGESQEAMGQVSKKPKVRPQSGVIRSFSAVAKDALVFAVIDRSHAEGTITPGNWKMVESALLRSFKGLVLANPGPSPRVHDAGWYQGHIKLMACEDERSANLYKLAIEGLGDIWPGAQLCVVPKDQIPNRPRSCVKLPADIADPDEILDIIRISNDDLPVSEWRVAKVSEPSNGLREVLIILNEESLPLLDARKGCIFYGFGKVYLRVYKADRRSKAESTSKGAIVEDPTAENAPTPAPTAELTDVDSESGSSVDLHLEFSSMWREFKDGESPLSDVESDVTIVAASDGADTAD